MAGHPFDALSRELAGSPTRRDALRLLLGGTFAAALARLGLGEVAVAVETCRAVGKRCERDKECCSKRCRRRTCRCRREGTPCTSGETCCSGSCDFLVGGGTCAPCRGRPCSADRPCCGGQTCTNGYCGGCRDRGVSCTSSSQCCFSDCGSSGACLSDAGGRCARDVDCRACYLGGNCANACVNGVCAV